MFPRSSGESSPAYDKVAESEELLSDAESQDKHTRQPANHKCRQRAPLLSLPTLLLVLVCSSVSAIIGAWGGARWLERPDKFCIRHANLYSPVVDEADLGYSVIRFNGSLLKANAFRQDAGPEVDAAWKSLGVDYRALGIPADKAAQSGLLPDQVKISQKYGGGYPANVEGLHQLHCLNLLRKSLWYNFDYYHKMGMGPFSNSDPILKFHVTHCLDIIRQQLMCQVDTAVLGQVWIQPGNETQPSAYVDFNTLHKCKNFEAVRAWAEVRQLPESVAADYLEPPKPGDRVYRETP